MNETRFDIANLPVAEAVLKVDQNDCIAYRKIGAGPQLLLVHGGAGSWLHWIRNINHLAQCFSLTLTDLPGMGLSPDVPDGTSTIEQYHQRIELGVRAIFPEGERFHLAGFSLGGAVSARLAGQLGEQALSLTMICPGGYRANGNHRLHLPRAEPDSSDEALMALHRQNLLTLMLHSESSIDEHTLAIQRWNIEHARFNGRKIGYTDHMENYLPAVNCPISLIFGDQDPLPAPDPQSHIDYIQSLVTINQLHLLPGIGHWANYEAADAVNRRIVSFIQNI